VLAAITPETITGRVFSARGSTGPRMINPDEE